ncbi:unnamed protein product [Paramecium octaurelia]|uniref:Kinesin-like protein n=1 Tax=Paramecium octaurelia TaxID=43137 RepID=A0A8S1SZF4_PAROT|nr:unnamed protein product [Paramecium octaurelia]
MKQRPLFLNVDLSPQPNKTPNKSPIQRTKTPLKETQKSQTRFHSPIDTQPTRQTSTIITELISKRSGATGRSQTQTAAEQEIPVKQTTDFQTIYQRSLKANYVPKIPHINAQTPPKQQSVPSPATPLNHQFISQNIEKTLPIQANIVNKQKEKVQIYIRIKPNLTNEKSVVKKLSNQHLAVHTFEDTNRQFEFDTILDNSSQEEVYNLTSKQIVQDCIAGKANGVVIVYGQTGSGKTHTMGLLEQSKGVIQLAMSDIFQQIKEQNENGSNFKIEMSFIQIYMDKIYDLLNNNGQQLQIRESKDSIPYIQGAVQISIEDQNDGIQLVSFGIKNRVVASQVMNVNSSRSHTLLTIYIKKQVQDKVICSKVAFIDLAGSERNKKSLSKGLRLDEATYINESLSALGNVIAALGQPNQQHVPYRESKLTRTLQGYLTGESQISLICTITKLAESTNETLQTLMFAQRCKDVVLRPQKIIPIQDEETMDNGDLLKQIAELKETIKDLQEQQQKQQISQQTQQSKQQDKDFLKFLINIILKLKQYTFSNLSSCQLQEKQTLAEKFLQDSTYYQTIQFPKEIQVMMMEQIQSQEIDQQKVEQCLDGNKEQIKDLAKSFTQDIHYLVQAFKQYSDMRYNYIIEKILEQYRQKEIQVWAKGLAYLLITIKQLLNQLYEIKQFDIASDIYLEGIKQQLYHLINDKGTMYKSPQKICDLIEKFYCSETDFSFNQMKKFSSSLNIPSQTMSDKYKQKIEKLIGTYGQGVKVVKPTEPPPIYHSPSVNVSTLIQSRKFQQNPFNDISSLTEQQAASSVEESNLREEVHVIPNNESLLQGKLRFKEDELLIYSRNQMAAQMAARKKQLK